MPPLAALILSLLPLQDTRPAYDRKEDVIYGRKYGVALTLDVFTPKAKQNGAGVVYAVSGGWQSDHAAVNPAFYEEFLRRGYVVFAVVHGSQPRFSIPEAIDDMNRAVRFVRAHAREYGVGPDRLGMAGASAGGHLSLMQGVAPRDGNPKAKDPVDQQSSRVRAVACFFPPTDFLNYGRPGEDALGSGTLKDFRAPFDFIEPDPATRSLVRVTDPEKRRLIGRRISPVYHVTAKTAPTLIIHGDADTLVPYQQAELMIGRLKAEKVPCELVAKPKAGHGWPNLVKDFAVLADWFDKHLAE